MKAHILRSGNELTCYASNYADAAVWNSLKSLYLTTICRDPSGSSAACWSFLVQPFLEIENVIYLVI